MNRRISTHFACLALCCAAVAQEQNQPTIAIDYEQIHHDRMLELQQHILGVRTNQWPRFREMMEQVSTFLDPARQEDRALWNDQDEFAGAGHSIEFYMPIAEMPAQYEAELARVLARLETWRGRGFFDLTADLAKIDGVMHPPDVRGQPSHVKLTNMRELARVQSTRLHAAADRGDNIDRMAAFEELLAANHTIVWFGGTMDWLVAQDGVVLACEHLLKAHLRRPIADDAWYADADATLTKHGQERWLPSDALIAAIHLDMLDHIQRTYTDDGAGDGVFLQDEYNDEFRFFENALASHDGPFATRREATGWLKRHVELLGPLSTATGQNYLDAEAAIETHRDAFASRVPMAVDIGAANLKVLRTLRGFQVRVAGTRVVLAIERYRLANGGAVPGSLDALGDLLSEPLRTDPLSGEPWVYRPVPMSTTEYGRDLLPGAKAWPYELWSRALPGIEQATEWTADPKNGVLITVPLQAPQYDAP